MDMTTGISPNKAFVPIDPRSKFMLVVAANSIMLAAPSLTRELAFVGLVAILLLNNKQFVSVSKLIVGYSLLMGLNLMVIPHLSGLAQMLSLTLVRVLRLYVPIVVSCTYLIQSTRVSEFIAAFQKMKVPDAVIIPFTVMFRFFPTIVDKWKNIKYAMRFRGMKVSLLTLIFKPIQTMEYILVPLLMSSSKTANELTAAALSRGLKAGTKRSSYQEVKFSVVEYLITLFLASIVFAPWV